MTLPDNGNPNPPNNAQTGEFETRPCPYCGTEIKLLPSHLPECSET